MINTVVNYIESQKQMVFLGCLVILIIMIGYSDVLKWIYDRSVSPDSYYSHSFIVPFISGYFIWKKKEDLAICPIEKSWFGLFIVIFSVLLHLGGTVLYIFSLSGFSLYFLVLGSILFLYGYKITKVISFSLLFLFFMFPLPLAIINSIAFPMKLLVAKTGVGLVQLMGIPVFREGFNISIPAGNLLVGNPCSGLRSLIAFLCLGSVFAYIGNMSFPKKMFLFLLSIPIAILSNMVRVPILILISHFYGLEAASPESFWHNASGILVFVLGFVFIIAIGNYLDEKDSK